jgi:hypothetical protein
VNADPDPVFKMKADPDPDPGSSEEVIKLKFLKRQIKFYILMK